MPRDLVLPRSCCRTVVVKAFPWLFFNIPAVLQCCYIEAVPVVVLRSSGDLPAVLLWHSNDIPMLFLLYDTPSIFLWCSCGIPAMLKRDPYGHCVLFWLEFCNFPETFLLYCHGVPFIFTLHSRGTSTPATFVDLCSEHIYAYLFVSFRIHSYLISMLRIFCGNHIYSYLFWVAYLSVSIQSAGATVKYTQKCNNKSML